MILIRSLDNCSYEGIVESRMDKEVENQMDTGLIWGLYEGIVRP